MIVRLRKLTLLTALALSLNPLLPASALGFMEAYRAALQNDPTYQAAIAENEAGQQNRAMGRAGLLPQISANASRARVRGEREYNTQTLSGVRNVIEPLSYFSTSRTVQVRQSVLNMAAIANFRQGRARAEYSTEVFRGKQNDLALRLSSAYFQALLSQHAIDLAQAKVQSIEQQLKTAEVQFKAGDGTVTDVDEARARQQIPGCLHHRLAVGFATGLSVPQSADRRRASVFMSIRPCSLLVSAAWVVKCVALCSVVVKSPWLGGSLQVRRPVQVLPLRLTWV